MLCVCIMFFVYAYCGHSNQSAVDESRAIFNTVFLDKWPCANTSGYTERGFPQTFVDGQICEQLICSMRICDDETMTRIGYEHWFTSFLYGVAFTLYVFRRLLLNWLLVSISILVYGAYTRHNRQFCSGRDEETVFICNTSTKTYNLKVEVTGTVIAVFHDCNPPVATKYTIWMVLCTPVTFPYYNCNTMYMWLFAVKHAHESYYTIACAALGQRALFMTVCTVLEISLVVSIWFNLEMTEMPEMQCFTDCANFFDNCMMTCLR